MNHLTVGELAYHAVSGANRVQQVAWVDAHIFVVGTYPAVDLERLRRTR